MAVTVVRGVAVPAKDSGSSSLSPEAVSTAHINPVSAANRAVGELLRSPLDQAVLSNRPAKQGRAERVRDAAEARQLAEDVSDDIRAQEDSAAHDGLDPVSAREHFRRH